MNNYYIILEDDEWDNDYPWFEQYYCDEQAA